MVKDLDKYVDWWKTLAIAMNGNKVIINRFVLSITLQSW
jgi:hypothetical protein